MTADLPVRRIISGGQTGVDRAALDVAIELGIPHGGWCPRGRLAEDGVIPDRYQLTETGSPKLDVRTRRNVRNSGGTLIISARPLTGGTALTERTALRLSRPALVVDPKEPDAAQRVLAWLREHDIETLNVAGPRAGSGLDIYNNAAQLLRQVLAAQQLD